MSLVEPIARLCLQSLILKDSAVFDGTAEFRNKVTFGPTSTVIVSGSFLIDQIDEKTPDHGVIVDGVLLKDTNVTGGILCANTHVSTDTIVEKTLNNGILIDAIRVKDNTLVTVGNLILNPGADIDAFTHLIRNVVDPALDQDAATKKYVDDSVNALDYKASVRAATVIAGTLASDFENGDTIDGVMLATGDRILIKDQASGVENGIYIVQVSGAPVRAIDLDVGSSAADVTVMSEEGTANADRMFTCTNDVGSDVVNTDALVFVRIDTRIDHGLLMGLADDDHLQYALLVGRAGGQQLIGGTAANERLILESTSNVTKGIVEVLDPLTADDLDSTNSTTLLLGKSNATKIEIANTGVITEVQGGLTVEGNVDTIAAATLLIGPANTTKVEIADTGVITEVQGALTVLDVTQSTTSATGSIITGGGIGANKTVVSGETFVGSYATAAGADAGLTVPNGTLFYKISAGTETGAFVLTGPSGIAGQILHVRNDSAQATTGLVTATGAGATFAYDGASWLLIAN